MTELPSSSRLRERFPALLRLRLSSVVKRIPFVQQMEASDCGAACLAMVLGYHGKQVPLREVREFTGAGLGGASALSIIRAARQFGLRGRGVRLEPADLGYLPPASLLHWGFKHFVVLAGITRKGVRIVDPAVGPRFVPHDVFGQNFTGVALLFEPTDRFEPGGTPPATLRDYLVRILQHRGTLARVLVTSLLVQLFALALPLLTGVLVDRIVPRGDVHLLSVLAAGFLSLVAFHLLASLVRAHLLLHLRTVLDTQLSLGFMDHLVNLPYGFFLVRPAGDLLLRLGSSRALREALTSTTLSTLLDGALVTLYLVLLFALSAPMGLLALALGLLQIVLFAIARRRYHDLMSRDLEVRARSQSQLFEMLAGMETLKSMGAEQRAVERWSHVFVDELNVSLDRGRLAAWVGAVMGAFGMGSPLVILTLGGYLVLSGSISLGTMLALSALAGGFLAPLGSLVSTALSLQEMRSHVERIDDVLSTPPEQHKEKVVTGGRLAGAIALEAVDFRYDKQGPLVLRDVSLEVAPGQKIAIVGRSGAGKSTLARLMVGLYSPTSGRVLFDGIDLRGLDLHAVREQIGVVTQGAYIFGTTVRANIALADPSLPLADLAEAARLAEVHGDIAALPMGYDTPLAGGGASLSGGQRQRIALARALVHRPAILVLDEATSEMDALTESRVMANLAALGSTRIVVAHRLSTVTDADLILVLEEGRLIDAGTHGQLLRRGGAYAALVAAQMDDRSHGS